METHQATDGVHQSTNCAVCGERKHTPLRNDAMGGYVCLTCIDREINRLQNASHRRDGYQFCEKHQQEFLQYCSGCALNTPAATLLEWHKGVEGTAGKDEEGVAQWYDGDRLLVIVETNQGREISVVHISCDDDFFSLTDSNGEAWGWEITDIEWWALLDKRNLPQSSS